ncbi:ERF family protein [Mitsuokella jalaludinii]|uniref:ERF family protein n=1 Tax=Mitsuokella jalaludinii TaxID=187979 RepID=UPI00307C6601
MAEEVSTAKGKPIYAALMSIQRDLKAPKGQTNKFGGYNYRSCEDILEAVKPLLNDNGLVLKLEDEPVVIDGWHYIKATASVIDIATGDRESTTAYAQEPAQQKGMSQSQLTGTASSYARKYALNGLFCIDDNRDADTNEYARQTSQSAAGARSQRNAYSSKGSANDDLRSKAMHALSKEMQRVGASGEEVSALCGVKFGKTNSRDLSTGELSKLAANLEAWIAEQMGGGK